jgi:hypothetical protein
MQLATNPEFERKKRTENWARNQYSNTGKLTSLRRVHIVYLATLTTVFNNKKEAPALRDISIEVCVDF